MIFLKIIAQIFIIFVYAIFFSNFFSFCFKKEWASGHSFNATNGVAGVFILTFITAVMFVLPSLGMWGVIK